MMRLIRALMGCSKRGAEADRMRQEIEVDLKAGKRQATAQVVALEKLVAEVHKDVTQWHR